MCEFCLKHGEGEKWYLQAKNYSEDLLSDVRRRRFIEEFSDPKAIARGAERSAQRIDRLNKAPRLIKDMISRIITRRMKKVHFGQVVPIEEIEQIFGFTNSITRIACICRRTTLGKEKRYCYGISMAPDGGKLVEMYLGLRKNLSSGPDDSRFERLTREEAISAFRGYEQEGLCHTVWTFQTPFIGAICNCDRSDCMAMRSTLTHGVAAMFRAST